MPQQRNQSVSLLDFWANICGTTFCNIPVHAGSRRPPQESSGDIHVTLAPGDSFNPSSQKESALPLPLSPAHNQVTCLLYLTHFSVKTALCKQNCKNIGVLMQGSSPSAPQGTQMASMFLHVLDADIHRDANCEPPKQHGCPSLPQSGSSGLRQKPSRSSKPSKHDPAEHSRTSVNTLERGLLRERFCESLDTVRERAVQKGQTEDGFEDNSFINL
jgi:hypothetical protein